MGKAVVTSAAALVVVVGGGLGFAAWSGGKVSSELQTQTAQLLKLMPNVKVVNQQVSKGLLSSTHEVTIQLGCTPAEAAGVEAQKPFQLTWRDRIQHGPLPGGKSVGVAAIDTELVFPPEVAAKLAEVFGNQAPLQMRTVIGFGGGFTSNISSPAVKHTQEGVASVDWQGFKMVANGNLQGGLGSPMSYSVDMPGFVFTGLNNNAGNSFKMGALNVKAELPAAGPDASIWMRPSKGQATIAGLEFASSASGKPMTVAFSDLHGTSEGSLDNGLFSSVAQFTAKGRVDDFALDKIEMQVSMRRVHAKTYEQMLNRMMSEAMSCEIAPKGAQEMADTLKDINALLRHDPEYAVDKFAVELAGKRAEIAYSAGVKGVSEADAALPIEELFKTKGYLNANMKVQTAWIEEIVKKVASMQKAPDGSAPDAASLQAAQAQMMTFVNMMIDQAAGQGFVLRENDAVTSTAKFEAGQFVVNGKPVPLPFAMQGRQ